MAYDHLSRTLAIEKKALGPDHTRVAETLSMMGALLREQKEYSNALDHQEKSLAIWEKALGSEHPDLVNPLSGIGDVLVHLGKPQQAIEPLERALRVCKKMTCHAKPHGRSMFALAQALAALGQHQQRAINLAKEAKAMLSKTPKLIKEDLTEITSWLKIHEGEI